ncbi:MAG: GDSL family lipase [Clostridia bacterium]|nr:GDSL family lipase [Clostridia bacterium]
MEIIKKISERKSARYNGKIPTIVFFGDSVTQGCFEVYTKNNRSVETVYDQSSAYHKYLADMLSVLFPSVPVNIINAGISGDNTEGALSRIEHDVLLYKPDLTVVCFGLNDCVVKGIDYTQQYAANLAQVFSILKSNGSEVIYMTPNMMCTEVSCHIVDNNIANIAADVAKAQNNKVLDAFLEAGKKSAVECGAKVCDVYAKWKCMYESGVDTNELLANNINHPTREMNRLFAWSLLETMFDTEEQS